MREEKWDRIWGWDCLIFKHYYYWLMLTYFLCFLGGKSVVFKLANALFRDRSLSSILPLNSMIWNSNMSLERRKGIKVKKD